MMWWRRKDKKPRRPLRARIARFVPRGRARTVTLWSAAVLGGALALWLSAAWLRSGVPRLVAGAADSVRGTFLGWTAEAGLRIDQILVEGREHTTVGEITTALAVRRGAPILGFDAAAARVALAELPWVAAVTVERRLPETIHVRLTERVPLALWQNRGRVQLIDRAGRPIEGAALPPYATLKLVVGEDAAEHAAALLDMIAAEPALAARVTHAVRVGGRRWTLRLEPGPGQPAVEILLPEINAAAAWARFAAAERAQSLIQRNVTAIDLRLHDRVVVRVGREPPQPPPPQANAPAPSGAPGRPARAAASRPN